MSDAETPGWGLCMGGSLHTDDGKPAASVFLRRITVFNKLTNKQCAMLLVFIVGILAVPAMMLVMWAIEALMGGALMALIIVGVAAYIGITVLIEELS